MSKRTDHLDLVRTDLTAAADGFSDAIHRLMDGRLGVPRASGGIGTSGGGSSSTVERAVLGHDCPHDDEPCDCPDGTVPDGARARIAEVDRILNRLGADAARLRQIVTGTTPHAPTSKDLREVAALNRPDDGCEHHATVGIYEQADGPTGTVSGNLTTPMRLCGFCYWQVYRKGVLPRDDALVERHRTYKEPRTRV